MSFFEQIGQPLIVWAEDAGALTLQLGATSIAMRSAMRNALSRWKVYDRASADVADSSAFYDRLIYDCFRGGLKSPRIASLGNLSSRSHP